MKKAPQIHMSVGEVAAYLKVTPRTVRNYLIRKKDPLPHAKPAGKVLVNKQSLEHWLLGTTPIKP
jgi:excisionase family DNA binding protein